MMVRRKAKKNDKEETGTDDKGDKGDKDRATEKDGAETSGRARKIERALLMKLREHTKKRICERNKVRYSAKTIEGLLNNLRSSIGDHAFHLAGLQRAVKHQHEVYRETWTHRGQQLLFF